MTTRKMSAVAFGLATLLVVGPSAAQNVGPTRPSLSGPAPGNLSCTAEARNISGFVGADGSFTVFNVPASQGEVRARVTCEDPSGVFAQGVSEILVPRPSAATAVEQVDFGAPEAISSRLALAPSRDTLIGVGATLQLVVTGTLPDGSQVDRTPGITGTSYGSSNPGVVTVDADGLVTARGNGTAIVNAVNQGALGFAVVTSLTAPIVALDVSPSPLALIRDSLTGTPPSNLTVTAFLADGSEVDITSGTSGTTYHSSNSKAVIVGRDGAVVGLQPGTSTITASHPASAADGETLAIVIEITPRPTGAVDTPGFAHDVDLADDVAVVADGTAGLQLIDLQTRAVVGTLDFGGAEALSVHVRGTVGAVGLGAGGWALVDVGNPSLPDHLAWGPEPAADVWLSGGQLFVASGRSLRSWDISTPASPVPLSTIEFSGAATAVAVDAFRGVAVVVTETPTVHYCAIRVVDMNTAPWTESILAIPPGCLRASDVVISGTTAYVANWRFGLHAVDITDPSAPSRTNDSTIEMAATGVAAAQSAQGTIIGASDILFVNAVPLFDTGLANIFNVDFSSFPGAVRSDADGYGIALSDTFGVVAVGPAGIQIFGTQQFRPDSGTEPPIVSLTAPTVDAVVSAGSRLVIRADATDDVQVAFVDFVVGNRVVATDGSPPYVGDTVAPLAGQGLEVYARATDVGGNVAESARVVITTTPVQGHAALYLGEGDGFGRFWPDAYGGMRCSAGTGAEFDPIGELPSRETICSDVVIISNRTPSVPATTGNVLSGDYNIATSLYPEDLLYDELVDPAVRLSEFELPLLPGLTVQLVQAVVGPATFTRTYTITNTSLTAVDLTVTRAQDGDLIYRAGYRQNWAAIFAPGTVTELDFGKTVYGTMFDQGGVFEGARGVATGGCGGCDVGRAMRLLGLPADQLRLTVGAGGFPDDFSTDFPGDLDGDMVTDTYGDVATALQSLFHIEPGESVVYTAGQIYSGELAVPIGAP